MNCQINGHEINTLCQFNGNVPTLRRIDLVGFEDALVGGLFVFAYVPLPIHGDVACVVREDRVVNVGADTFDGERDVDVPEPDHINEPSPTPVTTVPDRRSQNCGGGNKCS